MIEAKTTDLGARFRAVRQLWPSLSERTFAAGAVRSIGRRDQAASTSLTPKQAASFLRISVKTLTGHADDGEIRYTDVGRGKKNKRRMYEVADLEEFKKRRTRRDVPCQSTSTKKARSTISTSSSKENGFMALRDARIKEKQRPSSGRSGSARNNRPR